jgi:hypothetical protein
VLEEVVEDAVLAGDLVQLQVKEALKPLLQTTRTTLLCQILFVAFLLLLMLLLFVLSWGCRRCARYRVLSQVLIWLLFQAIAVALSYAAF